MKDAPRESRKSPRKPPLVIGWRETVSLPDLGLEQFKAKIDTGARTTALHASDIRTDWIDDVEYVSFHPRHMGLAQARRVRARIHARRPVRNTSGVPQERIVIRSHLHIADRNFLIEISLADRADMAFPMIVGRTAIRGHRLLVDAGRSFLTAPTPLLSDRKEPAK
ncbi:MAG: ATP-dependent zinc protease [Rhodobacterales bacterium]|nr:MAG: ATP-dependent zinc protease [Rhodobacterales bacterium]